MRKLRSAPHAAASGGARSWRSRMGRASPLLVLAVLATQGPPTSVALADTQTVRVSTTSASSVSNFKSQPANCPVGKKLVGTGYNINNGNREVRISYVIPNGTLTGVSVGAVVDADGYAGSWSLTATAVCTSAPLTGLEQVSGPSAFNLSNPKAGVATCPDGKMLLGTGFYLWGSSSGVVIEGVTPYSTTDSVTVRAAHGQIPAAGNWSVSAIAICADESFTTGVSRVVQSTGYDSVWAKPMTAQCPSGTVLFGAGGSIEYELTLIAPGGPPPPYPPAEVFLDEFTLNGSASYFPSTVTVWGNEDQDYTNRNWRVTAYALCYSGGWIAQA
jgi:hypothetical protein